MIKASTYSIIHADNEMKIASLAKSGGSEWILCLHGIQSDKKLFDDFLQQPFLAPFSVIAVDLVGFGDSSKPADFPYDLQSQAEIIEKMVQIIQPKKLHLIGHSLGGMVATLLLNTFQDILQSFINLEGNLILTDCGLSKEVADLSFTEFQNQYGAIKSKIRNSKTPGCIERAD